MESPVKFELEEVLSWGVETDKYGGWVVPVALGEEDAARITALAEENGAKNPLYGSRNTLYLKAKALSDKQKSDLLGKGRTNITVHFKVTGVYIGNGVSYLVTRVCKLRKLEGPTADEEEVPED